MIVCYLLLFQQLYNCYIYEKYYYTNTNTNTNNTNTPTMFISINRTMGTMWFVDTILL